MAKRNKIIIFSLFSGIILLTAIWIICCNNNCNFWEVTFYEILSISVGALLGVLGFAITIIIVEGKNDKRRFIDAVAITLDKMDEILTSRVLMPSSTKTDSLEHKKMMIAKRRMTNYLTILEKNCSEIKCENEIKFMKSKFDEYEIKVDTLYQLDAKISEEFKSEIDNLLGLIEHKICETRVSIFKR